MAEQAPVDCALVQVCGVTPRRRVQPASHSVGNLGRCDLIRCHYSPGLMVRDRSFERKGTRSSAALRLGSTLKRKYGVARLHVLVM